MNTHIEELKKTFKNFNTNLYLSVHKPSQKVIDTFLSNIDLP